ncbi:right-handed parallel beta-helix repeat-containing protein [Desulfococcaceae bacterium HSG8]|nr:right-handed parallel beta-helix repeat-containing protein [Desulfococcaceae bacterium HSG8]
MKVINLRTCLFSSVLIFISLFFQPTYSLTQMLPHTLTVTVGDYGMIHPAGDQVVFGGDHTWEITPDSGYEVDTLTDNGEDNKSELISNQYTLTDIRANHTIVVTFKLTTGDSKEDSDFICADSADDLKNALSTAATNGKNDEIRIVQGTYNGNFIYSPQEENKLTIKGGYTADCASREEAPSETILDGDSAGSVLTTEPHQGADFELDGVTIQNGANDPGLNIVAGEGDVVLANNIIINNTSAGIGGASVETNASAVITNNIIMDNSSGYYGGGIYINGSGTATFSGNTVSNNKASGAAGVWVGAHVTATLFNNVIINNMAEWYGGGIYFDRIHENYENEPSTPIILTNNTIVSNSPDGFLLHFTNNDDEADIFNNIIWNNQERDLDIDNDPDGDEAPVTSLRIFNNNFDQSEGRISVEIPFSIDPSNLNSQNPKFADPDNGDYRLKQSSPCIEAGSNSASGLPVADKDGNTRITPPDGNADMGAYEYVAEKGNLDTDNSVNLRDAILAIQAVVGENTAIRTDYVSSEADVSGDGKAGLEEAIYALEIISEIR